MEAGGGRGSNGAAHTCRATPSLAVGIVLLPNFTMLAFAALIDMLRLSADEGDRSRPLACSWAVISPELRPIRSSCGYDVLPREELGDPGRFAYLAVVGGLLPPQRRRFLEPRLLRFVQLADQARVGMLGVCTGSFALIEAEVIKSGGRCCVSWFHYKDLQDRFPQVRPVADRLWIRDGRVHTCAGGFAVADLAASLVQRHVGAGIAQKSMHMMLADFPRGGDTAQPQPVNTALVRDPRVRRAMLLMEQNLSKPLRSDELAAAIPVSRRQLERLFQKSLGCSVQRFGRDVRLAYACWLLTAGEARLSDIASQCGFADATHLSRIFLAELGCRPAAAVKQGREQFRRLVAAWWPHGSQASISEVRAGGEHGPGSSKPLSNRRPYE